MNRSTISSASPLAPLVVLFLVGCGSGDTGAPTDPGDAGSHLPGQVAESAADLTDFGAVFGELLPPGFEEDPAQMRPVDPTEEDITFDFWSRGEEAVLNVALGSTHRYSVPRGIEEIGGWIALAEEAFHSGAGTHTGSLPRRPDEPAHWSIREAGALPVPEECQPVLGAASVQVDWLMTLVFDHDPDGVIQVGYAYSGTIETIYGYRRTIEGSGSEVPGAEQYCAFRAVRDGEFASISVSARREHGGTEQYMESWAYDVRTADGSAFRLRSAWFVDVDGAELRTRALTGGGNADDAYAFRFMQFDPYYADMPGLDDPYGNLTRMISGREYTDLGDLPEAPLRTYVSSRDVYRYDVLPETHFDDPFAFVP